MASVIDIKNEGNALYKAKDFEGALKKYSECIEMDGNDMTYLLNMSAVYFTMKDYETCIAKCLEAIEVGKANHATGAQIYKAYVRLGNAYEKANQYQNAVEAFDSAMLEQWDKKIEYRLKGLRKEVKAQEALAYINPELGAEAKKRGNDRFLAGDFKGAVEEYSEAIRRDPEQAIYYGNRATARSKNLDFDKALQDCDKALELDPKYMKAFIRKGNIEIFLKKYHKALATFKAGIAIDPTNAQLQEGLMNVQVKIQEGQMATGATAEERQKRALEDPEVAAILQDPIVQSLLKQSKTNPQALMEAMKDKNMAAKIETLIAAGLIG